MSALELICPECEMVVDGAGDGMIAIMVCSNCKRRGKTVGLILVDRYEAEKRCGELAKRMFCRNCNYIGLVEEFPFDLPSSDRGRERYCHRCHSHDVINMAEVAMCATCDGAPAAKNNTVCVHCRDSEQDASDPKVIDLVLCEKCGRNPVAEGDNWCKWCISAESKQRRKPKKPLKKPLW